MEWEWTAWTEPHTWKQLHLASYRCRKTGRVQSQQCFQGTVRLPHLLRFILHYQSTLPAAISSAKQTFVWHKHMLRWLLDGFSEGFYYLANTAVCRTPGVWGAAGDLWWSTTGPRWSCQDCGSSFLWGLSSCRASTWNCQQEEKKKQLHKQAHALAAKRS